MNKIKIELPEVVEAINSNNGSKTKAVLEYIVKGKTVSVEEANNIIQKWKDYIQKLIPQTKFREGFVEYLGSSKESAISDKNSLGNSFALLGKPVNQDLLKSAEKRIDNANDSDGIYKVVLLSADWVISDSDGDDLIIASLDIRFNPQQEAAVETFNTIDAHHHGGEYNYYPSWQKGVELYLEAGKAWLEKFGQQMEIPLPVL